MSKKLLLTLSSLLLAIFGFFIATYLTILHYRNVLPPCSIAHGCEMVLTSKFSMLGPIPIALIGAGYYLVLIILLGIKLQKNVDSTVVERNEMTKQSHKTPTSYLLIHNFILILTALAFLISIFLVGIQAFILHAFCQWCLTTEGINLGIFILIIMQLFVE